MRIHLELEAGDTEGLMGRDRMNWHPSGLWEQSSKQGLL